MSRISFFRPSTQEVQWRVSWLITSRDETTARQEECALQNILFAFLICQVHPSKIFVWEPGKDAVFKCSLAVETSTLQEQKKDLERDQRTSEQINPHLPLFSCKRTWFFSREFIVRAAKFVESSMKIYSRKTNLELSACGDLASGKQKKKLNDSALHVSCLHSGYLNMGKRKKR